MVNLEKIEKEKNVRLASVIDDSTLWHQRLCHSSMSQIDKLLWKNLVRGPPKINYVKDSSCEACQARKQTWTTLKSMSNISTTMPLDLLHTDLFRLVTSSSLGDKSYCLAIMDDHSRFTWYLFLESKDEAFGKFSFEKFSTLCKKIHNQKETKVEDIRSNHGREFENKAFKSFYNENEIFHNFSTPRTQQNGVVDERIEHYSKWEEPH